MVSNNFPIVSVANPVTVGDGTVAPSKIRISFDDEIFLSGVQFAAAV